MWPDLSVVYVYVLSNSINSDKHLQPSTEEALTLRVTHHLGVCVETWLWSIIQALTILVFNNKSPQDSEYLNLGLLIKLPMAYIMSEVVFLPILIIINVKRNIVYYFFNLSLIISWNNIALPGISVFLSYKISAPITN